MFLQLDQNISHYLVNVTEKINVLSLNYIPPIHVEKIFYHLSLITIFFRNLACPSYDGKLIRKDRDFSVMTFREKCLVACNKISLSLNG